MTSGLSPCKPFLAGIESFSALSNHSLALAVTALLVAPLGFAGDYQIQPKVMATSAGVASAGPYQVTDNTGQLAIGTSSTSASYRIDSGLWSAVPVADEEEQGIPARIVYGPVIIGAYFIVHYAGLPGASYTIESTEGLAPARWQKEFNITVTDEAGSFGPGVFEVRHQLGSFKELYFRAVYPAY